MILGLTKRIIVVDAETCSKVDLKAHGAARYFADPSTRTLMVGLQEYGRDASAVWQPRLGTLPALLTEAAAAPPSEVLFAAFNAPFDRRALAQAGLPTPIEKWVDIMLLSYMLSFAGGLDQVLKAFDVGAAKAPEGKALIKRFSVLRQPWYDAPEEWQRFVGYCEQDVRVETQLLAKCCRWLDQPAFHPMVREVQDRWLLDQEMNQRGMPISLDTLNAAIHLRDGETDRLMEEMRALSGLDNPNSVQQLLAWAQAQGVPLNDLQAPNVRAVLTTLDPGSPAARVLSARLSLGKTSVKKFDAMRRMHVEGRLFDSYVTYGASRTGRTASRGINLSNLERPKLSDPEAAADLLETRDPFLVASFLPHRDQNTPLMETLGSCVRATITAPPGKGIGAIDLKSIESVGLAWLAGCDSILDLFFAGRDSYKDFATRYYGIAYEEVTSEQRKFSKPAVLGCLAADTLVLTQRGWTPILRILDLDKIWDGEEWVDHQGVIPTGSKETITWAGVTATPDHLFKVNGAWVPWEKLTGAKSTGVNNSGYGPSLDMIPPNLPMSVNVRGAGNFISSREITSVVGNQNRASPVPIKESWQKRTRWREDTVSRQHIASGCLIGSIHSEAGATIQTIVRIPGMEEGAYSVPLKMPMISLGTLSNLLDGMTRSLKLIVSTMIRDTKRAICGLLTGMDRTAIKEQIERLCTKEKSTPRNSSTRSSLPDTVMGEQYQGKYAKDFQRNKYCPINNSVKVPTYDIVECGPRNRFVILSDQGPLIAHNCGYGASGGALQEYAKGLGVEMSDFEAQTSVDIFRANFWEIPALWKSVDAAAKSAVRNPGQTYRAGAIGRNWPYVQFFCDGTFLLCGLPSGRTLFYYQPRLETVARESKDGRAFTTVQIRYMGKKADESGGWFEVYTQGPKLVENITQAVCCDVLYHGVKLTSRDADIEIIGTTYDEIIFLTDLDKDQRAIWKRLHGYVTTRPPWADDRFFLGADGYISVKRYRKD